MGRGSVGISKEEQGVPASAPRSLTDNGDSILYGAFRRSSKNHIQKLSSQTFKSQASPPLLLGNHFTRLLKPRKIIIGTAYDPDSHQVLVLEYGSSGHSDNYQSEKALILTPDISEAVDVANKRWQELLKEGAVCEIGEGDSLNSLTNWQTWRIENGLETSANCEIIQQRPVGELLENPFAVAELEILLEDPSRILS